jgi:hypothetical protein
MALSPVRALADICLGAAESARPTQARTLNTLGIIPPVSTYNLYAWFPITWRNETAGMLALCHSCHSSRWQAPLDASRFVAIDSERSMEHPR